MHGLLADPPPRRAALPRWIGAISQDRDRGRCDHDPILVEMVKEFMCVGVFLLRLFPPKSTKSQQRVEAAVKLEVHQRKREMDGKTILDPQHRRVV